MNKNHFYFLIISLLMISKANAQTENDSVSIGIDLRWKTEKLEINKNYYSNIDTLQLNTVKFYLSNIEIQYENGLFYKEKNSYHLIDIENEKSLHFTIPKNNNPISKVIFNIGIDSIASVSGALSGDLDVTNGMYWAWQSGYINMKIEGKSNSCKTRKNQFQFHIGGYLNPNYALRKIEIPIVKFQIPNNEILIKIDLSKFFETIHLSETNTIMIPGKKAMEIADLSLKMFYLE